MTIAEEKGSVCGCTAEKQPEAVIELDIGKIKPNPMQPRKYFDRESLEKLAESISSFGIIQPIIVKNEGTNYSIIAGERRWLAAKAAGLETVPVIIKDYSSTKVLQIALIENIQRADLNPIEEASCLKRLIDEYRLKQEDLAKTLGKSRQYIGNMLNLLQLEPRVQSFIIEGKLNAYHGRVLLLAKDDKEIQYRSALRIIEDGLSARAAERLIKSLLGLGDPVKLELVERVRTDYSCLEQDLNKILGTNVHIQGGQNSQGKIEIGFSSQEELERLLKSFGNKTHVNCAG